MNLSLLSAALPAMLVAAGFQDAKGGPKDSPPESKVSVAKLAANESGRPWAKAIEVVSEHYAVRTDVPEQEAREAVADLERLYQAFTKAFGKVNRKERFVVYLFDKTPAYIDSISVKHPPQAKMKDVLGFYHSDEGIVHSQRADSAERTLNNRRHECTHQLLDAFTEEGKVNVKQPYHWVYEGVPAYLESMEVREGGEVFGNPTHFRFRNLIEFYQKDPKPIYLQSFAGLDQQNFAKWAPQSYFIAAGVVHFFFHGVGREEREKFKKFIVAVETGKASDDSFQKIMGKPISAYQDQWMDYLKNKLNAEHWEKTLK